MAVWVKFYFSISQKETLWSKGASQGYVGRLKTGWFIWVVYSNNYWEEVQRDGKMDHISLLLAGVKRCILKTLTAETISTSKKEHTFRKGSTDYAA